MNLRDFINQFKAVCKRHDYDHNPVWADIPIDELQWLIDEEHGEWEALNHYLASGFKLEHNNPNPCPIVHCKTCCHLDASTDFCAKYQKPIPETFNQAQACNQWNES